MKFDDRKAELESGFAGTAGRTPTSGLWGVTEDGVNAMKGNSSCSADDVVVNPLYVGKSRTPHKPRQDQTAPSTVRYGQTLSACD